jgi:hypothetical protein
LLIQRQRVGEAPGGLLLGAILIPLQRLDAPAADTGPLGQGLLRQSGSQPRLSQHTAK